MSLLLALVAPAHALTCEEVMNMVNVNVPTPIVVQTLKDSGEKFNSDFVRCLTNENAPDDVVNAAKEMMAAAAAPKEEEAEVKETTNSVSKKSSARDEFDSTESIGSKSSSKKELKDLSDEGDDSEAADPEKLDDAVKAYNAKKPQQASLALYEMLRDGEFPDKEGKILYYLGRSLYDMKMYHSSQYYFIELLKKGTSNPYFKYALPKLVAIAKLTGDSTELQKIVAKIPPEEFPRSARNQLNYLLGVRLYEKGELSEARKYFGQISEKSDLYTRSKYFEGVIYNKQGKLKSAVRSFTDVAKTRAEAQTSQELQELDALRDLSLMNVARIYYGIQRYQDANTWYGYVSRKSDYWPESLFESAWGNFMLSDLNLSLGQILTVESPFYSTDEYLPEAQVLKALTYFNLCEFNDVDRILADFDKRYRPVQQELKDVVQQYGTDEGKKLADQAYDHYFTDKKSDTVLPKSLFLRVLRNRKLAGIVNHLDVMDAEEQLIAQQKTQWKNSVGEGLVKVLAEDRERLKRSAGIAMLGEMADQANYLGDLLGQAEIIKFEVVSAKYEDYQYKSSGVDLKDTSKGLELDFATSANKIYWPFNGEFWLDELGNYRFTEQGSCK